MSVERKLLGKVIISGKLECLTGLHIGASKENIEISEKFGHKDIVTEITKALSLEYKIPIELNTILIKYNMTTVFLSNHASQS